MRVMGGLQWIGENWVIVLNAVGVVGGLLFTGVSLRSETKTRRISNLLDITANHRELWEEFSLRPDLARVLNPSPDLAKNPITTAEEIFVTLVILQGNSAFYAMTDVLLIKPEGFRRDLCWFFSLPIPRAIWEKKKTLQNDDFVEFVERSLNWK
jgi:hypothetical protein